MKKLIGAFIILFLATSMMTYAETDDVDVTIAEVDIFINNQEVNTVDSDYPAIVYKDVTYFPMTNDFLGSTGLTLSFSSDEGLKIGKRNSSSALEQAFLNSNNVLGSSVKAAVATYKIEVNGKVIDNSMEKYPVLMYKNITYFPMTWRFAVEEFGWHLDFDPIFGLNILTFDTMAYQDLYEIPEEKLVNYVYDYEDYTDFELDEKVIGRWILYNRVDDFRTFTGFNNAPLLDRTYQKLWFSETGEYSQVGAWTKGAIHNDDKVFKYYTGTVNNVDYLFTEDLKGDGGYAVYIKDKTVYDDAYIKSLQDEKIVLSDGQEFDLVPIESKFVNYKLKDNIFIDYEEDKALLGKWKCVATVEDISTFDESQIDPPSGIYMTNYEFLVGGEIEDGGKYTKGLIWNNRVSAAERYVIATLNDTEYLIKEFKSGDYTIRHKKPDYRVYVRN